MFGSILIGTAILWVLSAALVGPISNLWARRALMSPAHAYLRGDVLDDAAKAELAKLNTKCYIITDVIVLGVAGLMGGLLGYWFIGISFKAKGWPGIIAFVGLSLLGVAVRSGIAPTT
jgi:hypothetical protein